MFDWLMNATGCSSWGEFAVWVTMAGAMVALAAAVVALAVFL